MGRKKTTTILLVRHGETVDNAARIMQGQTQGCLNDTGRQQASEVAARLSSENIGSVISSDLQRAIQTAQIIARPHGKSVATTPLLRERDWGSFTGRLIPELRGLPWPDDIESEEQLLDRALEFLRYATATFEGQVIIAVGHGIINKAILAVYAQCRMPDVQRMMNCEVRTLRLSADRVAQLSTAACRAAGKDDAPRSA